MTRILFHSYYFPPTGGAGAQRPLKLVRYLEDAGYRSIVVTGPGGTPNRWSPLDETLASEIPPETEVHRVPGPEPAASSGRRARAERWLAVRSAWDRWWVDGSVDVALDAAADAELIYVWMQPYNSAKAGAALAEKLGRPWIADLGDPWALDEMRVYPSALHRWRDGREMRRLLATATVVVMSTPEAASRLVAAFPELRTQTVVAIPNGYDAADFEDEIAPRSDEKFRIVHTGYLHTELGRQLRQTALFRRLLRGSAQGLDILTRSHVVLIDAIDRVLTRDPEALDILELHLAGVATEADRDVAARCPVATLHGYVSHAESIELMRTADLLFLPMHDLPESVRATIVPGKTYEYLAAGAPILGALPAGDARDLLAAAGGARLCRPSDAECLSEAILEELDRFRRGDRPASPRPEVVARYEYRKLASELARVFDETLGHRMAAVAP